MTPPPGTKPTAMAKLGRAVLQLRLFMRWTQTDLERASGVDQTTISRLERGIQTGLSTGRLAAILDALRVSDVTFDHVPTVPQTPLELMIYGDHWKRAAAEADRRLGWPQEIAPAPRAQVREALHALPGDEG